MGFLKLSLLAFWAAWFAVVFLTNLFGGMKALGRLPPSWRFASRNYEAVAKAVAAYQPPRALAPALFVGVLAWQLVLAALFTWAAASTAMRGAVDLAAANRALAGAILLWAAFMLADEATLKYEFERTHELLFLAHLATLLALHLLPG